MVLKSEWQFIRRSGEFGQGVAESFTGDPKLVTLDLINDLLCEKDGVADQSELRREFCELRVIVLIEEEQRVGIDINYGLRTLRWLTF